jgi:hypothetical protein
MQARPHNRPGPRRRSGRPTPSNARIRGPAVARGSTVPRRAVPPSRRTSGRERRRRPRYAGRIGESRSGAGSPPPTPAGQRGWRNKETPYPPGRRPADCVQLLGQTVSLGRARFETFPQSGDLGFAPDPAIAASKQLMAQPRHLRNRLRVRHLDLTRSGDERDAKRRHCGGTGPCVLSTCAVGCATRA